jgi:hypothetical protein
MDMRDPRIKQPPKSFDDSNHLHPELIGAFDRSRNGSIESRCVTARGQDSDPFHLETPQQVLATIRWGNGSIRWLGAERIHTCDDEAGASLDFDSVANRQLSALSGLKHSIDENKTIGDNGLRLPARSDPAHQLEELGEVDSSIMTFIFIHGNLATVNDG